MESLVELSAVLCPVVELRVAADGVPAAAEAAEAAGLSAPRVGALK